MTTRYALKLYIISSKTCVYVWYIKLSLVRNDMALEKIELNIWLVQRISCIQISIYFSLYNKVTDEPGFPSVF